MFILEIIFKFLGLIFILIFSNLISSLLRQKISLLKNGFYRPSIRYFIKLLFQENIIPQNSSTYIYCYIAPITLFILAMLPFSTLPIAAPQIIDNTTYFFEILSPVLGIISIFLLLILYPLGQILIAWSSNNPQTIKKVFRRLINTIGTDLLLLIILISLLAFYGNYDFYKIINSKSLSSGDFITKNIIAIIFFVTIMIRTSRFPFDTYTPQGKQYYVEIEYTSVRKLVFEISEIINLSAFSFFFSLLFLDSYNLFNIKFDNYIIQASLDITTITLKTSIVITSIHFFNQLFIRFKDIQVRAIIQKVIFPIAITNLIIIILIRSGIV